MTEATPTAQRPPMNGISDDLLEKMCRAHDREEAAQKGEPCPWVIQERDNGGIDPDWRRERLSAMHEAVTSALPSLSGDEWRLIDDVRGVAWSDGTHTLAHRVIEEVENNEGAPGDPFCGECNMGAGPHRRYCVYHLAKRTLTLDKLANTLDEIDQSFPDKKSPPIGGESGEQSPDLRPGLSDALSAMQPFSEFAAYIGGQAVTMRTVTVLQDEVLPDDQIVTIGNSSGYVTLRARHFSRLRAALSAITGEDA